MLIQIAQLSNWAMEKQEQRALKSSSCALVAVGVVLGLSGGVVDGVLAGVLVDGVVAGLFLLGCLMRSKSSLGSCGIFSAFRKSHTSTCNRRNLEFCSDSSCRVGS